MLCCGSTLQQLWCCNPAKLRQTPNSAHGAGAGQRAHTPVQDIAVTKCTASDIRSQCMAGSQAHGSVQLQEVHMLAVSSSAGVVDFFALPIAAAGALSAAHIHAKLEQSDKEAVNGITVARSLPVALPMWLHSHRVQGAIDKHASWTPVCWLRAKAHSAGAASVITDAKTPFVSAAVVFGMPNGKTSSLHITGSSALHSGLIKHLRHAQRADGIAAASSKSSPAGSSSAKNGRASGRWERASAPRASHAAPWQQDAPQLVAVQAMDSAGMRNAHSGMLFSIHAQQQPGSQPQHALCESMPSEADAGQQLWTTSIDRNVSVHNLAAVQDLTAASSAAQAHSPAQFGCIGAPVTAAHLAQVRIDSAC